MSGVIGEGDQAAQEKQNVMLLQEGGNTDSGPLLHFPTSLWNTKQVIYPSIFVEQLQKGNMHGAYLRILLIKYFLQSIEKSLVEDCLYAYS